MACTAQSKEAMLRDLLGDHVTEDVLNELNVVYQQIKVLGWKELRPWNEFIAVFKTPQLTMKHLEQRIITNALQYRSNYLCVCGLIISLQIVRVPIVLLTLVLIISLYTYTFIIVKNAIKIGGIEIDSLTRKILCGVISVALLAVTGTLEHLIWSLLYCLLLCGLHMIFRPRNVTSKTNRVYEEAKLAGFNWFGAIDSKSDPDVTSLDPENPPSRSQKNSTEGGFYPAASPKGSYSESKAESKSSVNSNVFGSFQQQYSGSSNTSNRVAGSLSTRAASKKD